MTPRSPGVIVKNKLEERKITTISIAVTAIINGKKRRLSISIEINF
jgi:hypothetical protein